LPSVNANISNFKTESSRAAASARFTAWLVACCGGSGGVTYDEGRADEVDGGLGFPTQRTKGQVDGTLPKERELLVDRRQGGPEVGRLQTVVEPDPAALPRNLTPLLVECVQQAQRHGVVRHEHGGYVAVPGDPQACLVPALG